MDTDFEVKDELEQVFCGGDGSEGPPDPEVPSTSSLFQRSKPNSQNYCVFCLQLQPQEGLKTFQGGSSKRDPRSREDFRTIIHFLTGTNPNVACDEGDCDCDGRNSPSARWISKLPPVMCPSCHVILGELYRLHRELLRMQWRIQKRTEVARTEIVTKILGEGSSSLSEDRPGMSAEVSQLIRKLHNKIVTKEASGSKEVKFPSSLPPGFTPADPQPQSTNHQRQMSNCAVTLTRCDNRSEPEVSSSPTPASSSSFGGRRSTRTHATRSQSAVSSGTEKLRSLPRPVTPRQKAEENVGLELEELVAENEEDHGFISPDLEEIALHILETEMELEGAESSVEGDQEKEHNDHEEYIPPSPQGSESDSTSSSESAPSSPDAVSPPPTRKRKRRQQHDPLETSSIKGSKKRNRRRSCPSDGDNEAASHEEGESTPRPSSSSGGDKSRRSRMRPQLILPLVVKGNVTSQHCDLCGELCPSSEIRHHLETQHQVEEFIVKCPNPSCPYVFSCRGKLEKHLKSGRGWSDNDCRKKGKLPPTPPRRRCAICNFKSSPIDEFRRHLRTHEATSTPEKKNLTCPLKYCEKKYALKQSLEDHLFFHDQEEWARSRSRRKLVDGVFFYLSQTCDLCGVGQRSNEVVKHLEEAHHVNDYITKCINPDCDKIYFCRRKMEIHLSSCRAPTTRQRGPTTIRCDACQLDVKRFMFSKHLQVHELQLKDKSVSCPIPGCTVRYALKQSVEDHLMTHDLKKQPNKSNQDCPVCRHSIQLEDMPEHLKTVHQVESPIPCKRCPFLFHDWEPLLDHMDLHRTRRHHLGGGGGFSCDLCDQDGTSGIRFPWYELLRQHFFNVHKIGKQFLCEVCDKDFFSLRALATHKKNKHSINPPDDDQRRRKSTKQSFKCDHCPELTFSSKQSLHNHKMKLHGAPPLPCKFCGETFATAHKLHKHQRIHLGLQRSYKCPVGDCDKVYETLQLLKEHERGAHRDHSQGASLLMCETCGKEYVTEAALKYHVETIHLGMEKPRKVCSTCGESFVNGNTLKRHELIHTGDRPHICPLCGQAFRTSGVLATHLKGHEEKGDDFKPNGPMKQLRKRLDRK